MTKRILVALNDRHDYKTGIGVVELTWATSKMETRMVESATGLYPHEGRIDVSEIEEFPYALGEEGWKERNRLFELYAPMFHAK